MLDVENPMVNPIEDYSDKVVAYCRNCNSKLYNYEIFLDMEGDYFCDEVCLKNHLGVKQIEGWEVE